MNSASIVGATGLIGASLLNELSNARTSSAWVRRPTTLPDGVQSVVSETAPAPEDNFWRSEVLFVALGTTIAKAGSQEAFESVDLHLVLECARRSRAAGCPALALVSAMGADPDSRIFYNRVKGRAERAILDLGFPRVVIARPSLLLGDRKEFRFGEWMSRKMLGPIRQAFPKSIRPVRDMEVARALAAAAFDKTWNGVRILSNEDFLAQPPDSFGEIAKHRF